MGVRHTAGVVAGGKAACWWLAFNTLASIISGQTLVDPRQLPERVRNAFDNYEAQTRMHCHVSPIKPWIDFGFRFRSGYSVEIPLQFYEGKGHGFAILTRVAPDGDEGRPSYLLQTIRLPEIPKLKTYLEVNGGYLLGEGKYKVETMVFDETGKACRKVWQTSARKKSGDRSVDLRLPPGAVSTWSAPGQIRANAVNTGDAGKLPRITILLHAAPVFPRGLRLRGFDREVLLGTLAALMEDLPASNVSVVMFNLDQQKRLFTSESFGPDDIERAAAAMRDLQLGTVDYSVLQNRRGHVDLLASLANKELGAGDRPDAVIFLGPASRYLDSFPKAMLEERGDHNPKFFYVQYRPAFFRRAVELPDLIQSLTKATGGKTFRVESPGEFAEAVRQIRRAIN